MTWRDFTIHVKAAEKKEVMEWHRTRAVMHMIYTMLSTDKIKKKPWQILPLDGDPLPDRGKPMDNEEVLRTIKLFKGNGTRNA